MNSSEKISVIVTEDHVLVRQAWCRMFSDSPGYEVLAECGTGEQAIVAVEKFQPQLVIMDINLPGINGIEATREILKLRLTQKYWVCPCMPSRHTLSK